MSSSVILHLSDLHFDSLETEDVAQARRAVALQGLIRALRQLFDIEPELRPGAICISGDIAYRGSRADYDLAEVWIQQLLQVLDLMPTDIIASAGNHDIIIRMPTTSSAFQ